MKKIILFLLLALPIYAQNTGGSSNIRRVTVLPATCDASKGEVVFLVGTGTEECSATNTWTRIGGGAISTFTLATLPASAAEGTLANVTDGARGQYVFKNGKWRMSAPRVNLLDFGADSSGGFYQASGMTSGSRIITLNSAWSTVGLVANEPLCMSASGAAGIDQCGTVSSYNGAGQITASFTAASTVANRGAVWGADSSTAIQNAVNYCATYSSEEPYSGCVIEVPAGGYVMKSTVTFPVLNGVRVRGRITFRCSGGAGSTLFIGFMGDQVPMFTAPYNTSVPVEFNGCSFVSGDYYAPNAYVAGQKRNIAINIAGGAQHRVIGNTFYDLYDGVDVSSSWLNLIDHNYFYGQYHASIYGVPGQPAPMNSTTISNNEFGFYHQYAILNGSNGGGGSNGNFYFGNDFEGGQSLDALLVSDVDTIDNYSAIGPNRWESQAPKSLTIRGTGNKIIMPFCNLLDLEGASNKVECWNNAAATSVTVNASFNVISGINKAALTGANIANTVIVHGAGFEFLNTNLVQVLGGVAGTAASYPYVGFNSGSAGISSAAATNTSSVNNLPSCSSPTVWNLGTFVINQSIANNWPSNYFAPAGWICRNSGGCTCPATNSQWMAVWPALKVNGEGGSIPTTGSYAVGDHFLNTSPTDGVAYWWNTTAGSPGTFRPWQISGALKTVTFSSTPTFDISLGTAQKIVLTANVTSSTLSNALAGQELQFVICQDSTGSRTFVWPTNVKGAMTIGSTLSTCSAQSFIFDGTNAYATSAGVTNQ